MQKRAFTLTELLIALGIIGTIAALSIISNVSLRCQLEIVSGKSYVPLTAFQA